MTSRSDVDYQSPAYRAGHEDARFCWWDAVGRRGQTHPVPGIHELRAWTFDEQGRYFGRGLLLGFLAASIVWFAGVKLAAQTPTVSTTTPGIPPGAWYFAVRAFNTVGLQSGDSNIVRVDCATASGCSYNWTWDANSESDLAGYILMWGAAPGIYTNRKTIAGVVTPGKLPAPPLRIRRIP